LRKSSGSRGAAWFGATPPHARSGASGGCPAGAGHVRLRVSRRRTAMIRLSRGEGTVTAVPECESWCGRFSRR
jgi:hypothetical protein